MSEEYNGWKNWQTWNVALWLDNDEGFHSMLRQAKTYGELRDNLRQLGILETPDHVSFNDSGLSLSELDNLVEETT